MIFVQNIPAHLAPGLDWVAASCDAVTDEGLGVQLALFNPIGIPAARGLEPRTSGEINWRLTPALYREHALFVAASIEQAREQTACGARAVLPGEDLAAAVAAGPPQWPEILAALRDIFTKHATAARLAALARQAGLPDGLVTGRQIAVAAQAPDVAAVSPLAAGPAPVELSLTGGKDSRLIAAALAAAKVPFRASTHGAADHPDVVVAAAIADRLGAEHIATEPARPGTVTPADVLARLRSAVLVGDGMLSAFENVGRPDPPDLAAAAVQAGGHGGELLRGGYAAYAGNAVRGAEQFRRLTIRKLSLLRQPAARAYLAGLAPWAARFALGPLHALDEFYLINRAGRWSAAARQAYLLRARLVQPFFDDRVVRAARAVRLRDRVSGRLHGDVLAALCPGLLDVPLAGPGPRRGDWRRGYGDDVAVFLRDYVLDQGPGLFDVISKRAAEGVLRLPHTSPETVWALATVAALHSGDWLSARSVSPPAVPGFGLPEERHADGERDNGPADPGGP